MRVVAYDTETTGLQAYHGAEMFSYSTATEKGRTFVQRLDGSRLRRLQGRKRLAKLWSDTSVAKSMHVAKFDLTITEKCLGRRLDDHPVHCTHKMSHLLQNHHHGHSLDNLAWELAECPRVDTVMRKLAKKCGGYAKVPEPDMTRYQHADAQREMLLFRFFWPKIRANPQWLECYNTEIELIWATMRMEARGLMVHRPRTEALITRLQKDVDEIREQLFDIAGRRFNINSPPQLRRFLFRDLEMPVLGLTKKDKKESTNKFVLVELCERTHHPALNMILKLRSYSKGVTTLEKYLSLADADDIIHPTINTCGAGTSRESCENPNLQNVQTLGVLLNPFSVPEREAFRPRPGYVNLHVDYAGIEGRLLVHYSGDPEMLQCINEGDGDIHSPAGEEFYTYKDRWLEARKTERKSLRGAAKNANYAAPYKASNRTLGKILGLKGRAASVGIAAYKKRFPKYVGLNDTVSEEVIRDGYVDTAFGRRLHVPIHNAYIGTNYLIQGTAAGILKRAQNRVHEYNEDATGGEVKILLPIHDEIVIEYPRERMSDLPGYLKDIRSLMIDFPQFKVPMEVEVEVSTSSWQRKREVKIPA